MKAWLLIVVAIISSGVCRADQFALKLFTASGGAVTVFDNGAGDSDSESGIIDFNGNVGNRFTVNSTFGASGIMPDWIMDISSINIARAADTMTMVLSQTGLTESFSGFSMLWGGVLSGPLGSVVSATAWADTTNTLFGKDTLIGELGPFGPGAFSGTTGAHVMLPAGEYALTQEIVIDLKGMGTYSGNLNIMHAPEPSTWMLLGSILAIGGLARRFRSKLR